MPRLTIIIPATGNDQRLEETLSSVLRHRPADCEVIVAHDGAYADPYDLGDEVRFVQIRPGASATALLNVGLGAARSNWLHVLWPGCEVVENWIVAAAERFRDEEVAAVAPWVGQGAVGALGCFYRHGASRIDSGEAVAAGRGTLAPLAKASFFRASSLRAIGGFDEWLGPDWAMIDAALALQERGERVARAESSRVIAKPEPVDESGGRFRQARDAERVFWRHRASFGDALRHAIGLVGESLRGMFNLTAPAAIAGRALGAIDASRGKRRSGVLRSVAGDDPTDASHAPRGDGDNGAGWRADRAHAATREPRSGQSLSQSIGPSANRAVGMR